MSPGEPVERPADVVPDERWERLESATYVAVPYLGLAVSTVLTLALDAGGRRGALVLAGVALAWMVTGSPPWRRPGWAGERRASGVAFVVGLLALQLALCLLAPWFGFLCIAGYVQSARYLPGRWWIGGVAVTALSASLAQAGGLAGVRESGPVLPAVMLLFNRPLAAGFTYFNVAGEAAASRRKRTVVQLTALNERLGRLSEENAGLHAQLLVQAREAGVLDERARLAREIHDTLAQGLTGIITQLQAARGVAGEEHDRHLRTALDLARESLTEARRSVAAMAPRSLAGASLPAALEATVGEWSERSAVPGEVRVTGDPVPLHPELEATLLRTAQEALSNVARHARAGRAVVTLSYLGEQVALDVRDDGAGFDPAATRAPADGSGFGLLSMRQRVQRLAGTFEIDSEPGGGTAVSARVPAIGA
jgi:signal transduction histidine kinase